MTALLVLLGCDGGAADGTLLQDIQVVHVGAEPPEVGPGEGVDLVATVVEPLGQGATVLAWPCTDLGEGCLEDQGQPVADWAQVVELEGEDWAFTVQIDPALAALFAVQEEVEGYEPVVSLWVMACRPGVCARLDGLADGVEAGSSEEAALRTLLQDPQAAMAELPIHGASLVRRDLPLSELPVEERNANPQLSAVFDDPLVLSTGQEALLEFDLWDDFQPTDDLRTFSWYGFATVGGISPARATLDDGALSFVAGEEPGAGRIYLVVLDHVGGSGLWRGDVIVE